jgi:cytochrome P450
MPFGGGPRICIGASFGMVEAQIMLATLLSRFRITYNEPRPVMPVATPFMAPRHEPMFGLERV